MIVPPTLDEIYNSIATRLKDEAGLTLDSNSSVTSALVLGVSSALENLYTQLADIERSQSLDLAQGTELDRLGQFLGVSRRQAQRATTAGNGPAVIFKNNSLIPINIPQGTMVFPKTFPGIIYKTISPTSAPSNGITTIDVTATTTGPEYNVAAYTLNAHNLGISDLVVYNPRAISSGDNTESDESYRARLFQATTVKDPSSKEAIRQNLANLPGVQDAFLYEGTSGPGTFEVLLIGQSGNPPTESLYEAQNYLNEHSPLGVSFKISTPSLVFVDIIVKVSLTAQNEPSRGAVTAEIAQSLSSYIDSLSVEDGTGNGVLVYSSLLGQISLSSISIKDYTIDLYVDGRPIIFGSNVQLDIKEKFTSRKIVVK